jgi:serine protease Do
VLIQTPTARGSGFFARPDLIVTTARLVAGSSTAAITTRTGTHVEGKVVFQSEGRDLALLQIPKEAGVFPALSLGRSETVRSGQSVVALGWADSPAQSAATLGTVTSVKRDANQTLVQTNAAPGRGDSGGPLLDRSGNVLGITTFPGEGDRPTAGFAVGIDDVKPYFVYVTRHE